MSLLEKLRNLVEEPPPAFAFELGPAGIAYWKSGETGFTPIPAADPQVDSMVLTQIISLIVPPVVSNRKRAAAVILPDHSARISIMDFDQFPRKSEEQQALIRFRLKRTVPFDVDTAILRYQVRPRTGNQVELTVAAIAIETLAPYETAFRNAGFHPGFITIAGLSAANLALPDSMTLRLSGQTLTLCHFEGEQLRLFRCLELQSASLDEILNVVDPTLAYLEDERKTKPAHLEICGLEHIEGALSAHMRENWGVELQPLRSTLGTVNANNAGLHGYLASMGVN